MTSDHKNTDKHLDHAARIALRGHGNVEPNPMVGCVITDSKGVVVAEGHHRRCGGPHAEVIALKKAGTKARGGHLYVTLEPCDHQGRTGPCSEAIIEAGIVRVVYAHRDSNEVAQGGDARLQTAGILVEHRSTRNTRLLNAAHEHRSRMKSPWVIAKWAQTLDGWIATSSGDSKWISSDRSRRLVHRERGRVDAILTGLGTVIADDPQLTPRMLRNARRIPARVVIDDQLEISMETTLVKTAAETQTFVCCTAESMASDKAKALEEAGVRLLPLGKDGAIANVLAAGFESHGWSNVLVEAGGGLVGRLAEENLLNEVLTMVAPTLLGDPKGFSPIRSGEKEQISDGIALDPIDLRVRDAEFFGWYQIPNGIKAP